MPVLQPSSLLVVVLVTLVVAKPIDDPTFIELSLLAFKSLKPVSDKIIVANKPLFAPKKLVSNDKIKIHSVTETNHKTHPSHHSHHKHNQTVIQKIQKQPPPWLQKHTEPHKDGCASGIFSQEIRMPGCESKFVLNRYCHGACISYYIPGRSKKLQADFEDCPLCRPAETEVISVPLRCDDGIHIREIVRVKRCQCSSRNVQFFRR